MNRLFTLAAEIVAACEAVNVGQPFDADWDFWRAHDHDAGEADRLQILVFAKAREATGLGQTDWQHKINLAIAFEKKLTVQTTETNRLQVQRARRDEAAALFDVTEEFLAAIKSTEFGATFPDVLLTEVKAAGAADVLPDAYTTGIFARVVQLTFDEEWSEG